MLIYSETSLSFIKRARELIRGLFFEEISKVFPVTFHKSRIHFKNFHYPLSLVVFDDNQKWGYFDYRRFEIGLSKKLMYQATDEVLKNIIRHELAHYLTYLFYGPDLSHGKEFHFVCNNLKWEKCISKASMSLDELKKTNESQLDSDHLIEKVKKLLALADSDNEHESQIATSKANKLILDYNLERISNHVQQDENIVVLRALEAKNKNAKLSAIVEILKSFFVSPIFNLGKGHVYLELIGEKKNVLIAEYVAHFLDHELERLYQLAKKNYPELKGKVAKNSFFRGVAIGYNQKISDIHQKSASKNQLMIIKHDLEKNLAWVYPNLSSIRVNLKENQNAMNLGKSEGLNLNIKKSVNSNSQSVFLLE